MIQIQEVFGQCGVEARGNWVMYFILLFLNGLVLLVGSIWAWETRKVQYDGLNDSVQVGYILILVLVVAGFELGITQVSKVTPEMQFHLIFWGLIAISWVSIMVIFFPKFLAIMQGPEAEEAWVSSPHASGDYMRRDTTKSFH